MSETQTRPPFKARADDGREILLVASRQVAAQSGPAWSTPPHVGPWGYRTSDGRPAERTARGEYVVAPGTEDLRVTSDDPWQPE